MFDISEIFCFYRYNHYYNKEYNLFTDNELSILKSLVDEIDIKIVISINNMNNIFDIEVSFKSKLLVNTITSSQHLNKNFLLNNNRNISTLYIVDYLIKNVEWTIISNKRTGIFTIKQLPHKYFTKKYNIDV
jgi:hypothetical protein